LIFLSRDFAWNGKLNQEKPYEIFFARFSGSSDFAFIIVCLINIIIENISWEKIPQSSSIQNAEPNKFSYVFWSKKAEMP
jgi:hypothetical protein